METLSLSQSFDERTRLWCKISTSLSLFSLCCVRLTLCVTRYLRFYQEISRLFSSNGSVLRRERRCFVPHCSLIFNHFAFCMNWINSSICLISLNVLYNCIIRLLQFVIMFTLYILCYCIIMYYTCTIYLSYFIVIYLRCYEIIKNRVNVTSFVPLLVDDHFLVKENMHEFVKW